MTAIVPSPLSPATRLCVRTRNGLDWTEQFQSLVRPLPELPCEAALLDGEMAVADEEGHTDFGALQDALSGGKGRIGYYLFDLLELDGEDLRKRPLIERKQALKKLLASAGNGPLSYSDHVDRRRRRSVRAMPAS